MYCLSLLLFFEINWEHQACEFNGGHDFLHTFMCFGNTATFTVEINDYRIHFGHKSKVESVSTMENVSFNEKSR